jgi:hypothetical protein
MAAAGLWLNSVQTAKFKPPSAEFGGAAELDQNDRVFFLLVMHRQLQVRRRL